MDVAPPQDVQGAKSPEGQSFWLTRQQPRIYLLASLLSATAFALLAALRLSAVWWFISCVFLASLAQSLISLRPKLRGYTFGTLFLAGFFNAMYCFATLAVAPSQDSAAELVGSLTLLGAVCVHWLPRCAPPHMVSRSRLQCLGDLACLLATALLSVTVVDAVWGMHAIVTYGPGRTARLGDLRINYYCAGAARDNTIVVLEPGYSGAASIGRPSIGRGYPRNLHFGPDLFSILDLEGLEKRFWRVPRGTRNPLAQPIA